MSNTKELAICFVAALVFVYIQSFDKLLMVAGLTAFIYASYQVVKRIR